jgi:arylsulfatase A-like enzyme
MRRAFLNLAGFGSGATLGGLFVGGAEAFYFQVEPLWAILFYGTLWGLVGVGVAALVAPLWRQGQVPTVQVRWGLCLSLVPSVLLLVRFVVKRDLLAESPRAGLIASGAGLVTAVLVLAGVLALARRIRRRFDIDHLFGPRAWLAPGVVILAFVIRAQAGDDALPEAPPPAKTLAGRGVVLAVFDALRADALGVYGAAPHRGQPASPHFDTMAARGLTFADVSAQASWTKPAVASILTSRYPSGHGTMAKTAVLPDDLPTLAEVLHSGGIATAAVVTNYNLEPGYGFGAGFDAYHYLSPARYLGAPERANRLAGYNVYRLLRERLWRRGRQAKHFYRPATTVNAVALEALDRIGDRPFFLYLHFMEPHDPYFDVDGSSFAKVSDPHPPLTWASRMRDAYRDEVHRADAALGELVAALAARGLTERVTVVATADHGEELGDHGGFYHGLTLYEEMLHLPLIVAGPGVVSGIDARLARGIDIAPTIASLLGVPPSAQWQGRDLLSDASVPPLTLAEEDHEGNVLQSVRIGGQKLIVANADNPRGVSPIELFDLQTDPLEKASWHEDLAQVEALRHQLAEALAGARRGAPNSDEKALDADAEAELRSLGYVK